MNEPDANTETSDIRHDLLNVLSSLHYGCTLLRAQLQVDGGTKADAILNEMLRRVERGNSLVERLRQLDPGVSGSRFGRSGACDED